MDNEICEFCCMLMEDCECDKDEQDDDIDYDDNWFAPDASGMVGDD